MKAGAYYCGDLAYVMHEDWDEVCSLLFPDDSENLFPDKSENMVTGEFTLKNGVKFACYSTKYGDGTYYDQNGNNYSVDAGIIGCILVTDIVKSDQNNIRGGNIHTFDRDFETEYDLEEGNIYIGHIIIETGDMNYDHDECLNDIDDE
jgi:hypothetical protein